MSVSGELLCSFELLKPLDSSALKSHIKKGRNKRQTMLNSPVCSYISPYIIYVFYSVQQSLIVTTARQPVPPKLLIFLGSNPSPRRKLLLYLILFLPARPNRKEIPKGVGIILAAVFRDAINRIRKYYYEPREKKKKNKRPPSVRIQLEKQILIRPTQRQSYDCLFRNLRSRAVRCRKGTPIFFLSCSNELLPLEAFTLSFLYRSTGGLWNDDNDNNDHGGTGRKDAEIMGKKIE